MHNSKKSEIEEKLKSELKKVQSKEMGAMLAQKVPAFQENRNHQKQTVVYLAALGQSTTEIVDKLNVTREFVKAIIDSETGKKEIDRVQKELFLQAPEKLFDIILPKAVSTAYTIMTDKRNKPNVRLEAAFKFMDRALGKPVQEIKTNTSTIQQLFQAMDSAQKAVDTKSETIEAEFSTLDQKLSVWVDEVASGGTGFKQEDVPVESESGEASEGHEVP